MAQASEKRPLSPHLQVYRWQITNTLSILHRMTGVALSLGLIPLSLWLWGAAYDAELFNCMQGLFKSPIGMLALFGWTVAFFYHFANGLRHLWWDAGRGFELPTVIKTGWLVVFFTLVMAGFTWAIVARKSGWM